MPLKLVYNKKTKKNTVVLDAQPIIIGSRAPIPMTFANSVVPTEMIQVQDMILKHRSFFGQKAG